MTKPSVTFNFDTIELAFEYANFDDRSNEAYLDRHTGDPVYFSMVGDSDDVPDDFDDATRYVARPDTRELGLGSQLAIQFASETAPALLDEVRKVFKRRGRFRRFKDVLDRNDLLASWYEYQAEKQRTIILQWCADNDICYTMDIPGHEHP